MVCATAVIWRCHDNFWLANRDNLGERDNFVGIHCFGCTTIWVYTVINARFVLETDRSLLHEGKVDEGRLFQKYHDGGQVHLCGREFVIVACCASNGGGLVNTDVVLREVV